MISLQARSASAQTAASQGVVPGLRGHSRRTYHLATMFKKVNLPEVVVRSFCCLLLVLAITATVLGFPYNWTTKEASPAAQFSVTSVSVPDSAPLVSIMLET